MSLPTTPAAYNDCYEIWDAAIRLGHGCRTLVGPEANKAEYLRARMHQARQLQRNLNKRAYPPDHPSWGTSEYDSYKTTIKIDDDGDYWLYVEYHGNWAAVANIEPIPPDERGPTPDNLQAPPAPATLPSHSRIEALTHAPSQDSLD